MVTEHESDAAWVAYSDWSVRMAGTIAQRIKNEVGLSLNDYSILSVLRQAPGGKLRMGQLADVLAYSPSRPSYQVSALVKRELVKKTTSSTDGRSLYAEITPAGQTMWNRSDEVHRETIRAKFLSQLDEKEHEDFVTLFAPLVKRMSLEKELE